MKRGVYRDWWTTTRPPFRFVLDLKDTRLVRKIRFVNYHYFYDVASNLNGLVTRGFRALRVYVSTTNPGTGYGANVNDGLKVLDVELPINSSANDGVNWTEYGSLMNIVSGQFVVFDVASNWGDPTYTGVRRCEFAFE